VSCHRIAAHARTHEPRASATGQARNDFGILLVDRFHFEIKWIAVEAPCRQLSSKRSKPYQFIFIRVQQPVSKNPAIDPSSAREQTWGGHRSHKNTPGSDSRTKDQQSRITNDRDLMTKPHHQSAAAHPTPPGSSREHTSHVVDLVTAPRNLKTEDLKTVPPKKHTNSSRMPHFRCNAAGSILGTLPRSDSSLPSPDSPLLSSAFGSEHRTLCPPFVRTSASFMRTNDAFMSTSASLMRTNAAFVLVSQLTCPLSNNPFVHTNEALVRTNASFVLASHLIDSEILNRCRSRQRLLSSTESITATLRSIKMQRCQGSSEDLGSRAFR
jgi:hypothetical protein